MSSRTLTTRRRSLTAAAVAGPAVVWFGHLLIAYLLVPAACDAGSRLVMHLVSAAAVALSAATLAIAIRDARANPRNGNRGELLVLAQGGTFLFALLLTWLSIALVDPCA